MNNNYLKIGETLFELNYDKSYLEICILDEKIIESNIYCKFNENEFDENSVEPHIEINNIPLSKNKIEELVGILFEINDVNESFNRGDSFYLLESEPFINYKIEVLEINSDKAHVLISGDGITDGYSKPYKTRNFIADVYISVRIKNKNIISKEEHASPKKENNFKNKILPELLCILMFGGVSYLLFLEFLNTHKFFYIIFFLPVFLIFVLLLYSKINEIYHLIKYKNCLRRKTLINIINSNNSWDDDSNYNKLLLMKTEVENHKFYNDRRFMPNVTNNSQWRHIFLRDEAIERIKNGDINFAYKNLFEFVCVDNPALIYHYGPGNFSSKFKEHQNYYKDGFICKQEKDIIMEIIIAIEKEIKNE